MSLHFLPLMVFSVVGVHNLNFIINVSTQSTVNIKNYCVDLEDGVENMDCCVV